MRRCMRVQRGCGMVASFSSVDRTKATVAAPMRWVEQFRKYAQKPRIQTKSMQNDCSLGGVIFLGIYALGDLLDRAQFLKTKK